MSADLRPKKDPIEVNINPWAIIIGAFIFALVFWVIGTLFRYYVYVGGSV